MSSLAAWPDHPFRYLGEDGEIKIHSRGRFRTGDLGCLDADGFLMLTGREKEQIIRGGAKISPVEIDSYLMQRADVIEAATVGVPDAVYGEEVVSYVVTRPGAPVDADELLRYCATVLPAFKAPKQIVISALAAEDRARQARPQGAGAEMEEAGRSMKRSEFDCPFNRSPRSRRSAPPDPSGRSPP